MYKPKTNNIMKAGGLLTMAAFYVASPLFAPGLIANVSAQSCNGWPSNRPAGMVDNFVKAPAIDSTASSLAYEITPSGAPLRSTDGITAGHYNWGSTLSKSDCTGYIGLSTYITASNLSVSFYDASRTSAFVSGTDYANLAAGATTNNPSNTSFSASLMPPTVSANTPITVKYDLVSAGAGWVRYSYQVGSAAAVTIVDVKLPATDMIFANADNSGASLKYSGDNVNSTTCSDITVQSAAMKTRILYNGVAQALTVTPTDGGSCGFVNGSYDAATKTATLGHNTVGVNMPERFTGSVIATSDTRFIYNLSGTEITTTNGIEGFSSPFTSTNNPSELIYFGVDSYQDGKATPKDVAYFIASGNINFSGGDVDLKAKGVVLDNSAIDYKAVAHNLSGLTSDGKFTLYVPYRDGDVSVGICPGAVDLASVKEGCENQYFLGDGMTKTRLDSSTIPEGKSVKASRVTIGSVKYWQVDGLTSTGGFSSGSVAAAPKAPDTGVGQAVNNPIAVGLAAFSVMLLAVFARLRRRAAYATTKK